jgi:Replication protein
MMQATRVQKFVTGRTGVRYIVLAERNSKNLREGILSLYRAWNRLRRSTRWKGKVKGSIAVLEVTYNNKYRTWHPHLNVLFGGDYFPFEELKQAWMKATEGRGRTAFIRAADSATAYELLKYTLKIAESEDSPIGKVYKLLIDDPAALDEFLSAVYGVRLIRTYGTFRSIAIHDDLDAMGEECSETCPDCGSSCWVDLGPVLPDEQLSFDFNKKVYRVSPSKDPARAWFDAVSFRPIDFQLTAPKRRVVNFAVAVEIRRRARCYESAVLRQLAA